MTRRIGTKEPALGKDTLPLGFGSCVRLSEVVALYEPNSAPAKRLRLQADRESRLVDMTKGRRTRAIVITKSNHVLLSMVTCELLRARMERMEGE